VDERLSLESPDLDPAAARVAAILATLVAHRQIRQTVEDRPGSSRWRWSRPGGGWPQ
jgi:hypothetical protein